jgi:hypothetical protein
MALAKRGKFPTVEQCLGLPQDLRGRLQDLDADIRQLLIRFQVEMGMAQSNSETMLAASVTLLLTIAASNAAILSDPGTEPDFLRAAVNASAWSAIGMRPARLE